MREKSLTEGTRQDDQWEASRSEHVRIWEGDSESSDHQ